jgi:hypothetical protein
MDSDVLSPDCIVIENVLNCHVDAVSECIETTGNVGTVLEIFENILLRSSIPITKHMLTKNSFHKIILNGLTMNINVLEM